ncbi:MAG: hypothetical protein ACLSHU_11440 [Oscillospiraceae bacterium]
MPVCSCSWGCWLRCSCQRPGALRPALLPLLLPALGYAIHALFGISQSLVSPLFYLFLGTLARASRRAKSHMSPDQAA